MKFDKGSEYTRHDVSKLYFGMKFPMYQGGTWTGGYWQIDNMLNPDLESKGYKRPEALTNELIIWMNIEDSGRTGHDYSNSYDEEKELIVWYGKPGTHSRQPIFSKLISGDLTPHFFGRWDSSDTFTYLGVGDIIKYEDGQQTETADGELRDTIKLTLTCLDDASKEGNDQNITVSKLINPLSGQGTTLSGPERKAIELRAMSVTYEYLISKGYTVEDTSSNKPYDYLASMNGEFIKVEVKGSSNVVINSILMTHNEVKLHQNEKGMTALAIVSSIKFIQRGDNAECEGGELEYLPGWDIDNWDIKPKAYQLNRS